MAGPIERSGNLLNQLRNIHTINIYNWENVIHGFRLMIWGYFEKLLIADRAAILVDLFITLITAMDFGKLLRQRYCLHYRYIVILTGTQILPEAWLR